MFFFHDGLEEEALREFFGIVRAMAGAADESVNGIPVPAAELSAGIRVVDHGPFRRIKARTPVLVIIMVSHAEVGSVGG